METIDMKSLKQAFNKMNNAFVVLTDRKTKLEEKKVDIQDEIDSCKLSELEMYNVVLQKMADRQRKTAAKKLEHLGTCALQYAIGPNYSMDIDITPIRKKPNAQVFITKSNGVRTEVNIKEGGNGGGIIDIGSSSMRVISLESHEPFIDGPVVFDEPGKMVSKEYIPSLSEFIKKVGTDFGRQIILVTHNDYLAQMADTKIRVSLDEKENKSSISYE